jgi:RecA/RadA recombinase
MALAVCLVVKENMVLPFDISKLRKGIDKSIQGLSYGFNDPKTWLSTGCYALNYLISDDFFGGIPLEGKFTMFAGDSGSGKSYIASANIIKDAQKKSVFMVLVDTENALDESWLKALDVDTSPDKMLKISGATIDDVSAMIGMLIDMYKAENDSKPYADRPKLMIIIDSLGMLITPNNERQYMEGDQKGDMGLKAKQITNMLRVTMAKIAAQPIGLLATNHVYDSQDQYKPDTIPGGKMLEFASSVIVQMNKYLLKEDENGVKLVNGAVAGIRSTAVVRKSRYAKPFEKVYLNIPYDKGMDPYSGLFDLFEKKGIVVKDGMRWVYSTHDKDGVVLELKDYKKNFRANGWLDRIMAEAYIWDKEPPSKAGFDNTESADYDPEKEDA